MSKFGEIGGRRPHQKIVFQLINVLQLDFERFDVLIFGVTF